MSMSPIEVVKEAFARFLGGDLDGALELMDEHVRVEFYGPDVIPYAGVFHGPDGARRFLETVRDSVDINLFQPEQHLCDGDTVTVTGRLDVTAKATGKPIKSPFAHVVTIKDGKWLRFRDFQDSAAAMRAFTP